MQVSAGRLIPSGRGAFGMRPRGCKAVQLLNERMLEFPDSTPRASLLAVLDWMG
jgi:hypothetical protein